MEELKLCGVCTGARSRHENDKMLSLFCEDGNVYDVLARGALKPKYKLKFATQLFSCCDYFLCSSKAGYYVLGGASFGELSFFSVASDPDAYAAACFVCEVVNKSVKTENKRMYAETVAALGELAAQSFCSDLICLRILLAALDSSGYGYVSSGRDSEDCVRVASAAVGSISQCEIGRAACLRIIRTNAGRFAALFGKLNSLDMILA